MPGGSDLRRFVVEVHMAGGSPGELRQLIEQAGFRLSEGEFDPSEITVLGWETASTEMIQSLDAHRSSGTRLVVVLRSRPSPVAARALLSRADGVVMADAAAEGLELALHSVLAGQTSHPRSFREALNNPALTIREKQVLAMVVLDLPNAEIARKLVVTQSNVKNHLTSAFSKLGVRTRTEAAALILDRDAGLGLGILRILPTPEDAPATEGRRSRAGPE